MQLSSAIFINNLNLRPLPTSHLADGAGISALRVMALL
jgi:hypothetical protein